jgi:hypothetical protein
MENHGQAGTPGFSGKLSELMTVYGRSSIFRRKVPGLSCTGFNGGEPPWV